MANHVRREWNTPLLSRLSRWRVSSAETSIFVSISFGQSSLSARSLPLLDSLSSPRTLSLSLYLSLTRSLSLSSNSNTWPPSSMDSGGWTTTRASWVRPSWTATQTTEMAWGGVWKTATKMMSIRCLHRALAAILGSMRINSSPFVVMVPSVRDESDRICNHTLFETNCQNFDSRAEPNEVLFSGTNFKFLIVAKNHFQ